VPSDYKRQPGRPGEPIKPQVPRHCFNCSIRCPVVDDPLGFFKSERKVHVLGSDIPEFGIDANSEQPSPAAQVSTAWQS